MTFILFDNPEDYVGMTILKKKCKGTCRSFREYKKKNGEMTYMLLWDCISLITGKEYTQETGWRSVISAFQNHQDDKSPARVLLGKHLAEKRGTRQNVQ